MTKAARVLVLLGALFLCLASSDDGDPPGPKCRVGCPCGQACIDCRDTCHLADESVMTPEGKIIPIEDALVCE